MSQPYHLTTATPTPADATRLTRFVNAAYRGETARQGWTTESDLLDDQLIAEEGCVSC